MIAEHLATINEGGTQGRLLEKKFRALEEKLRQTQSKQHEVNLELSPLRQAHGKLLGAALRPKQRELAGQALEALETLADIWSEIEALSVLVESEGGSIGRLPPLWLHQIGPELGRLAGGDE
jgi:hypothetical protein